MRLFIEVPVWLGDTIMASVAVENVMTHFKGAEVVVFGSKVATEVYKAHPSVSSVVVDESKQSKNRWQWLYQKTKTLGKFDLAISFRRQWSTRFLLWCVNARQKARYRRLDKASIHQVKRYNDFAAHVLGVALPLGDLVLPFAPHSFARPTLGLNPGATYGSAKRWYPEEFAKVAIALSSTHDIVIFGGPSEQDIALEIETLLHEAHVTNVQNLAGKTTIAQLCAYIGGLAWFITNDSGPLHVSAAYKVNTVAIFGPTMNTETHGWHNPNENIIKLNLPCQPCMKRVCPLGHHACMREVKAKDVLDKIALLA